MLLLVVLLLYFFFFKQKTAYEMRISDWSSDVCSSDLAAPAVFSKASRLDEEREYNRVRKVLGDAIAGINTPAPARHRARQSSAVHDKAVAVDTVEFSTYRQRYVSLQQNMETRSEEHTSELQSLMRISYAVFYLKKKKTSNQQQTN